MIFRYWLTENLQRELREAKEIQNDLLIPQHFDSVQDYIKAIEDELKRRAQE